VAVKLDKKALGITRTFVDKEALKITEHREHVQIIR
jgi:hypothetical protein